MFRTTAFPVFAAMVVAASPAATQEVTAYTGATLWDGTGAPPLEGATLVVRQGRIVSVGEDSPPPGARVVDLKGRWIIPGLINAHGHVTGRWAPEFVHDPEGRIIDDLALYASYGVTTVNSLGGGGRASIAVRNRQKTPHLKTARLLVAGPVVTAASAEEGVAAVERLAAMGVDWVKIRVDDNLGTTEKMAPSTYRAIIRRAHDLGLRVATHLYYLADAKALLVVGSDLIAHSVRDAPVDPRLTGLLRQKRVCYVPTLTREVSTFVYAEEPDFFSDPFFLDRANLREYARLTRPEFQARIRESPTAAMYRDALEVAKANLKSLSDAGVSIAMGTDSGPPGRFPGYFEHMELELMVESGLTPEQVLLSATGVAARCLGLEDTGTLETGKWADFLVLAGNPLEDITNTRTLEEAYIAGNPVR